MSHGDRLLEGQLVEQLRELRMKKLYGHAKQEGHERELPCTYGGALREANKNPFTAKNIAAKIGISDAQLWNYEFHRCYPSMTRFGEWCDALGVVLEDQIAKAAGRRP